MAGGAASAAAGTTAKMAAAAGQKAPEIKPNFKYYHILKNGQSRGRFYASFQLV
jgi:hypothetical protein